MAEWLDIVDSSDKVIGRATRDEIHAKGHLHRSVHVVLHNSRGQVFVQLRSLSKDNGPGLWDTSAAGHVDSGEGYLQCAVRELDEELGVTTDAEALQWIGRLPADARTGFEFTEIYALCSDQELTLQPEEIDDGRWVSPTQLDQWLTDEPELFTEVFHQIWGTARPLLGKG